MLNRLFSVFLLLILFQCRAFPQQDSPNVTSSVIDSTLGSITIKSRPSEAGVFIDNSLKGVTPLKLTLPAGKYSLRLLKDGYESSVNSFEITGSGTRTIDDSLYSIPKFNITTIPANAFIYIDSSYAGRSPMEGFQLSSGRHRLRVSLDGYKDLFTNITLRQGESSSLRLSLLPKFGFLTLNVSPSDAEVIIDSLRMTPERVRKLKLPVGEHDLMVYNRIIDRSIKGKVYIAPRVESEVSVPLDKFSARAALFSAVLPGLGQFLDGSYLKGSIEFLSAAAAGYLISSSYDIRRQRKVEEDLAYMNYLLAIGETEAFTARERLTRADSDLKSAESRLTMSFAALGAVYGLTIIDALIFHSKERSFYIKRTILPYEGLEKYGSPENFELGVNLRF
ncbi:MAG TPA: PEGA domain-containing protein [Ignavibacteriales bacterium]|nr:PEGA domain-containing protein [Ignavibacteriales bacterium]